MAAGPFFIGTVLLLMLIVVPIGLGTILMISARRGGPGYPACGACRYNLGATVGVADRCPECGALFTKVGILPPQASHKPWRFWGGLAMIVLTVTCLGSGIFFSYSAAQQAQAAARARAAALLAQQQALAAQAQAEEEGEADQSLVDMPQAHGEVEPASE